jgi:tetratricopeptide (TPR) repeat protein
MGETNIKAKEYLRKGEECYTRKNYNEAVAWFTKSIQLCPSDAAHDFRGCAYLEKEEYDKAISDFSEAIKLCLPEDSGGLSKIYYNRAESYRRKGDNNKALMDVRQAIKLNFLNRQAQKLHGYLTKSPFPPIQLMLEKSHVPPLDPKTKQISLMWLSVTKILMFIFVVYVFINYVIRGTERQAIRAVIFILLIVCLYLINLSFVRKWIDRE